jgi:hypothetical protein
MVRDKSESALMTDKPKPRLTANQLLEQKLRETHERSERYQREHAQAEASAAAGVPGAEPASEREADEASGEQNEESKIRRWEEQTRRYADAHGGLFPPEPSPKPYRTQRQPRLADPAAKRAAPARDGPLPDTETLLNALIEECRFLMREVAFHSMRLTPDADDRLRFMSAAESLAVTGAKVGETVAKLRGGNGVVEERRQRILVEHVQTLAAPQSALGRGVAHDSENNFQAVAA